jgi:hypothetical protein
LLRRARCDALLPVQEGIMASSTSKGGYSSRGPTLVDCQKLWDHLVTEYVTDLQISLEFQPAKEPGFIARVVCWSPGLDPETGGSRDHAWGAKDLQLGSEAFTYVALYDLLIVSYRAIQHKLSGQQELPLL